MSPGQKMPFSKLCVGIDISATTASVALLSSTEITSRVFTIDQTEQGFKQLSLALWESGYTADQTHIVMEATGIYWIRLASQLHQMGYQVSVVNPVQAHHFAQARLQRAKSNEVDAQNLKPWPFSLNKCSLHPVANPNLLQCLVVMVSNLRLLVVTALVHFCYTSEADLWRLQRGDH